MIKPFREVNIAFVCDIGETSSKAWHDRVRHLLEQPEHARLSQQLKIYYAGLDDFGTPWGTVQRQGEYLNAGKVHVAIPVTEIVANLLPRYISANFQTPIHIVQLSEHKIDVSKTVSPDGIASSVLLQILKKAAKIGSEPHPPQRRTREM